MKGRARPTAMAFREYDALAYDRSAVPGDDEGRATVNYVGKRSRVSKGMDVTFDPASHKEFLTGFHKRKVQRRNKAMKQASVKEHQARLEARAQKRAELKAKLGLGDNWGVEASDSEKGEDDDAVDGKNLIAKVTYGDGRAAVTTTVTTLALDSGPEDSSSSSDGEGEAGEAEQDGGAHASGSGRGAWSSHGQPSGKGSGAGAKPRGQQLKAVAKLTKKSGNHKAKNVPQNKKKSKSFKKHMKAAKKNSNSDGGAKATKKGGKGRK